MSSQSLKILIDFTQDLAVTCTILLLFFKVLNLNNSGTGRDIKEQLTAIFLILKGLSDRAIKSFTSLAL